MILQKLAELATAENLVGDPAFELRPVSWVVRLRPDGTAVVDDHRYDLNDGEAKKKPKMAGRLEQVPAQPGRTSGDKAFFLVDKSEYAIGVDPTGARPEEKLALRLSLFRNAVVACAEATGDDAAAAAVAAYLGRLADAANRPELPKDVAANDLFAFRYGDGFVHDRPAVVAWWREQCGVAEAEGGGRLRCLVTGRSVGEAPLVPLVKSVPGGSSSGVALVSFNNPAYESFGQSGNDNAALSAAAARDVSAALNRLLSRRPVNAAGDRLETQRVDLSTDSTTVYWSSDPQLAGAVGGSLDPFGFDDDATPRPERVREALTSIWRGRPPEAGAGESFHAMTLSGTQGRLVVRDWFEQALPDTLAALARWFADVDLTPSAPPTTLPPAPPLRAMLDALAPDGRETNVPASLASQITRAAMSQAKLPRSLVSRVLLRERAEAGKPKSKKDDFAKRRRRDLRLGLLKAWLIRDRLDNAWLTPSLAEDAIDPAYVCGRAFAAIERTQRLALDVDHPPVTDRLLRVTMAEPARGLPPALDGFRQGLEKLAGDESRRRTAAFNDRLMVGLIHKLDRFPPRLDDRGQGLFLLGRHHQQQAFFTKKPDNDE